ncbi:MAG: hypothetical protein K2V38_23725, partial [Gemmataceae bacterium]|nr:hypothetical protein [Gemmataceae bacterium]
KGVLILVALSYLSGAGLFFMKRGLMEQVQGFFAPVNAWSEVESQEGHFRVMMPNPPHDLPPDDQPLKDVAPLRGGRRAVAKVGNLGYSFTAAGSGPEVKAEPTDEWFRRVGDQLRATRGKLRRGDVPVTVGGHTGREWEFEQMGAATVVRVFIVRGRVYYLSVEGSDRPRWPDAELAKPFFDSFQPLPDE